MNIREWFNAALYAAHEFFSCYLPEKISRIFSIFLKLFYSGIRIEKKQIEKFEAIPEDAIIVYAVKYKGMFEFLFYHSRYGKEGLPVPEIAFTYNIFLFQPVARFFGILFCNLIYFFRHFSLPDPYESGFIREQLLSGKAGLISLIDRKNFHLRFIKHETDPIRYLIELQKTTDRPVVIIPQLMFFNTEPTKSVPGIIDIFFGTQENPGKLRRIYTLFRKPGKVFVEISEPLFLKDALDDQRNWELQEEELAVALRRRLIMQMNRHRQSITGPILKRREELKQSVLTTPRFREYMERFAKNREISLYKVHREAEAYLEEIAANYNIRMIKVFSSILTHVFRLMFDDVILNQEMLDKVRDMARKGPVVFIPCHKSHIDYLILPYLLFHNNLPVPHCAAGKNLSFWPMGPIFRSGGAFFLRRTFRGAVLYSKVFSEYIFKLLEEGFNIEFFIEGGRSRTGKLLQPKLGFLSILLNAYREGVCDEIVFAPLFIGYDQVLEEGAYIQELSGGKKKPEDFKQVVKARKFLRKKYGKIYIQFHEPLSLNDLMAWNGKDIRDMTSKEFNVFCRNLGRRIMNGIDRVAVVTPYGVVAAALLNSRKQRFSLKELMTDIDTYMSYLFSQDVRLADTLQVDYNRAVESVIDVYIQRKFIEKITRTKGKPAPDTLLTVNASKRPGLEYYKNNSIIFFIHASITALCILDRDAFQFHLRDLQEKYAFLMDLFQNEFSWDLEHVPEFFLRKNIKAFIDDAILMPHPTLPDTFNLTSAGFRKLKLFASFLKTFFESYLIVLKVFSRYPKDFTDPKGRMKKIYSMGNRMVKRKEITRPEAVSKINFSNGIEFFMHHGVRGSEDTEKIKYYSEEINRYLTHLTE